jgi:hypothetical protein
MLRVGIEFKNSGVVGFVLHGCCLAANYSHEIKAIRPS